MMLTFFKKYKWALSTGIISVAFILSLMSKEINPTSRVATININAIMMKYVQTQAKATIDSDVLQKDTKAFVKQLEHEIQTLSKNKNITLFVSEAILAGASDYTPELESRVYKALKITRPV